jgi:hypothetical protein
VKESSNASSHGSYVVLIILAVAVALNGVLDLLHVESC